MNVLSLFDGMSCGRIALERAGIPVTNYFASEIDRNAIAISKHNWPDIIQLGDVTKLKFTSENCYPNNMIENGNVSIDVDGIDLLIGGSPCQGFSSAGKQLNFNDPRSKLFFEFVRLKEECFPTYFLLENVRMPKAEQDIISSYLGVEPVMINSNLFSAQNRERLYWTNIPVLPIVDKNIYLENICESESGGIPDNLDEINAEISNFTKRHIGITIHENGNIRPYQKGKAGIGELTVICNTKNKSNTFVKTHVPKIYTTNPFKIRKLNRAESERLQTVPFGYTDYVSYNQAISALGNGWTVDVIAHIFKGFNDYARLIENFMVEKSNYSFCDDYLIDKDGVEYMVDGIYKNKSNNTFLVLDGLCHPLRSVENEHLRTVYENINDGYCTDPVNNIPK